jgi:hypothetical protein
MSVPPVRLVPLTFQQAITLIASLDQVQFQTIERAVRSSHSFEISDQEGRQLAQAAGLDVDTILSVFSVLAYMYGRVSAQSLDREAIDQSVRLFLGSEVPGLDETTGELLAGRLLALLQPDPKIDALTKQRRLQAGFLRNIVQVSSFVDIRPDFSDDRVTIRGAVPVVELQIRTDAEHPVDRDIVLQLNERTLQTLKSAIEDIELKLILTRDAADLISSGGSD